MPSFMLPLGRSPTLVAFTGRHCLPRLRATYTNEYAAACRDQPQAGVPG